MKEEEVVKPYKRFILVLCVVVVLLGSALIECLTRL